jgi:hypothetical protein
VSLPSNNHLTHSTTISKEAVLLKLPWKRRLSCKSGIKEKIISTEIGSWFVISLYSSRSNNVTYSIFALKVGPSNSLKSRFIYNGHWSQSVQTPAWCIQIELCLKCPWELCACFKDLDLYDLSLFIQSLELIDSLVHFWLFWKQKKAFISRKLTLLLRKN